MVKGSLPPGYRFHPTDVELVWYYLKRKVLGKPFRFETISVLDLYQFSPWDLPGKATLRSGDLEWYFFCPRGKKYSHGSRTNRATKTGYWKATGKDRDIVYNSQTVGMKKTLIFHLGKPPSGERTDWVMYEFRLQINDVAQDTYVLCKIFRKSGAGPKNGEQYGAPVIEEDWDDNEDTEHGGVFPFFNCQQEYRVIAPAPLQTIPPQIGEVSSHNVQLGGLSSELPHHNFGVGEPSNNFEVGGPSSVPNFYESGTPSFSTSMLSEVELPSRQVQSEPGEFSYASETPGSGILLTQLEEILNTSPPNLHIVNDELFHLPIQNEDASQVPEFNLDSIYDDLGDLPVIPYPGGSTDLDFGNTMSCDFHLDPALLAELAEEHFVTLSDFSLANDPHLAASPTDPIARANADTATDTNALVEAYLNSEEMDNENSPQPRGPDDSGNDQKL